MKIDIDLVALDAVSRSTRTIGENVRSAANQVKNTEGDVQAAWKSDTSQMFVNEIDDVSKYLNKISAELDQLSNAIRTYSNKMRQLEKENSAMFKK